MEPWLLTTDGPRLADVRVFEPSPVSIQSPVNSTEKPPRLTLSALVAMAESSPCELAMRIHAGDMSAGLRARAAEAMGRVADSNIAVPVLLTLMHDKDIVVQEGAIYGLRRHMTDRVREELERVASNEDTHYIIRDIAMETIES